MRSKAPFEQRLARLVGVMVYSKKARPIGPYLLILGLNTRRHGDMASYSVAKGVTPVLVDTKLGGDEHDLTDDAVVTDLCALACAPDCVGVYLSAPCKSWSAAKYKFPGPPPLRSLLHCMGLRGLAPNWRKHVDRQNLIVAGGVRVLRAAAECGKGGMAAGIRASGRRPR